MTPFHRPGAASRRADAGYTLIDMLTALFVIGLAAGVVAVTMPAPPRPGDEEARGFAAGLRAAADEALVSGLVVGVEVDAEGYAFFRRVRGEWTGFAGERLFRTRSWSSMRDVAITLEGGAVTEARYADMPEELRPDTPALLFDPIGAATPAEILLDTEDGVFVVTVDAVGEITLAWGEDA